MLCSQKGLSNNYTYRSSSSLLLIIIFAHLLSKYLFHNVYNALDAQTSTLEMHRALTKRQTGRQGGVQQQAVIHFQIFVCCFNRHRQTLRPEDTALDAGDATHAIHIGRTLTEERIILMVPIVRLDRLCFVLVLRPTHIYLLSVPRLNVGKKWETKTREINIHKQTEFMRKAAPTHTHTQTHSPSKARSPIKLMREQSCVLCRDYVTGWEEQRRGINWCHTGNTKATSTVSMKLIMLFLTMRVYRQTSGQPARAASFFSRAHPIALKCKFYGEMQYLE